MEPTSGQPEEIIQGVGNEVFYFFLVVLCLLLVVGAWFSTHVMDPVFSSVIVVERTPLNRAAAMMEPEDHLMEEAVSQFLQQQDPDPGIGLPAARRNSSTTTTTSLTPENEAASSGDGLDSAGSARRPEAEDTDSSVRQEQVEREPEPDIPEGERVTIRLKFLNETQKDVEASLLEKLHNFKRRNFTEEISANKIIRLIFNGKVLREEENTLQGHGLFDKCVVHCLIHQNSGQQDHQQQQQPHHHHHHHHHHHRHQQGQQQNNNTLGQQGAARGPEEEEEFDVSDFFIPILGGALVILWYFAFIYSNYFNFMSTAALIGLTSLYFLSVYGTHFHVNVAVRTT